MFLTRLGFGSKMVVTGDITQVDLPGGTRSGLRVVRGVLDKVDDIAFCNLTNHDVVRHKLVGRIVAAYDKFEANHLTPRGRVGCGRSAAASGSTGDGPSAPGPVGSSEMSIDISNESGVRGSQCRPGPTRNVCPRPARESIHWPNCRSCSWTKAR